MQKKLLSGLFWVLILNLAVKSFWILGIEVGVQKAVGVEQYGLYNTLFNIAYIFNILLDIGVTNFNTRNIAQNPELIHKHLSGILSIKLILCLFYLLVTFSAGLLIGYRSYQFALLAILAFNQFLNSMILYLRSNFEGLLLFKWDSVLSILDRVVMILICGFLLWIPKGSGGGHFVFRIEYFIGAQTVAYLVAIVCALVLIYKKVGLKPLRFDWSFSRDILHQSLPFALLVLLMASYNRLDPILLHLLSGTGDYQSGIYAGAFRLLDALTMIAYLVSVPLLPVYAQLTKSKENREEIAETTHLMTSMVLVFSIAAAVTFSSMHQELMELLYIDHIDEYAEVFQWLIWGIIPISLTYVFGTLLTANGNLRYLNWFAFSTLIINIVVNVICIPRFGARGSAYASLIAQSFMALAQIVLSLRLFRMRPSLVYLLQIIAFTAIIVVANQLCSGWGWWQHLLAIVGIAFVAAIALRLINIKKIISQLITQE